MLFHDDARGAASATALLLRRLPPRASAVGLALLLGVSWLATYVAGGSHTALPHIFYVPIVLAAVIFGVRGGLLAALAATVLCGPAMPFDVATGEAQGLLNWLTRGVFFVTVGAVAGLATEALRRVYEQGLTAHLRHELDLGLAPKPTGTRVAEADVRAVLASGAFHPVFQPVYSLRDGLLIAVEALTRFDEGPAATPDLWFAAAARAGLDVELELAALDAALEAADGLPDDVALSVNVSPSVVSDPGLLALLRGTDRAVIVELTEHTAIDDYRQVDAARSALRRAGVRLAVDDAGAGFASLRHIVRLAPEIIKLDVSLTQDLRHDPVRRALANCLIQFAHQTGSQLVAEGIEQGADLDTWRELGAHAAQGYLLGRPGALADVSVRCDLIGPPSSAASPLLRAQPSTSERRTDSNTPFM